MKPYSGMGDAFKRHITELGPASLWRGNFANRSLQPGLQVRTEATQLVRQKRRFGKLSKPYY